MRKFLILLLVASVLTVSYSAITLQHFLGENLCPIAQATHVAVKSGDWESPDTWADGNIPADGSRVHIPCNCWVTLHTTTAKLQWMHVEGVVDVCDHCPTLFRIHTIYIPMMGRMYIGTSSMPIQASAGIEFLPGSEVGLTENFLPGDWQQLSLGLICHGDFKACGANKTPWIAASNDLAIGATQLSMPADWVAGDEIMVAGTDSILGEDTVNHKYQTEFRTLTGNGTWDTGLKYKHWKWRADLPFHIANLTRNVVFRSFDPSVILHRGHIMFMSPMNDIRFARHLNLGRTDKSRNVTDPRKDAITEQLVEGSDANTRARYADHNHRNGALSAPFYRYATVIDGSPGWGLVNHASHGDVIYCVGTRCFGSCFTTEEGQERGSFQWCLAGYNRGQGDTISSTDGDHGIPSLGDWGKDGSGFWFQGGMVDAINNVSFDNSGRGFALFNQALNSYPDYAGPQIATWIQFPIVVDKQFLTPDYFQTSYWKNNPVIIPSMYVPQRVFSKNTAYGNKVGVQSWDMTVNTNHTTEYMPPSVRGNIDDLTLWGRGNMLHFEYTSYFKVTGLKVFGDSLFRSRYFPSTNAGAPILTRGGYVEITNYSIDGMYNRNNWPNVLPILDVPTPFEKSTRVAPVIDGTYPIRDGNTGSMIR